MFTIQGLMMKTEYMMEQIRQNALNDTIEQFKAAARHYYETCEGGTTLTKLIKDLENLGANMDEVTELDLNIRDEVFGL